MADLVGFSGGLQDKDGPVIRWGSDRDGRPAIQVRRPVDGIEKKMLPPWVRWQYDKQVTHGVLF